MTPTRTGVDTASGGWSGRWNEHESNWDVGAGSTSPSGDDPSALAAVVEGVFDPIADRIIYERDALSPVSGERASQALTRAGRVFRPAGHGIAAAAGFLDARNCVGAKHWIVVVTDAAGPAEGLCLLTARRMSSVERLVVVSRWPASPETAETVAGCRRAGWRVYLLSQQTDELQRTLTQVRSATTPALVLLPGAGPHPSTAEGGTSEDVYDRLVGELLDVLRRDPRLLAAVTVNEFPWLRLLDAPAGQSLYAPAPDLGSTLVRLGAAAEAGCHVLAVVELSHLLRHKDVIVRELSRLDRQSTLIVVDPAAGAPREAGWPRGVRRLVRLPGTQAHLLSAASDPAKLLRHCLESRQPRLLYCPVRRAADALPSAADAPQFAAVPQRRPGPAAVSVMEEFCRHNRGVFVIVLSDDPHWREFTERVPQQSVYVPAPEALEALGWAAALGDLDGHVLLVMGEDAVRQYETVLRDKVCAPFRRVTLVVDSASADAEESSGAAGRVLPRSASRLAVHDLASLAAALEEHVNRSGPSAIVLAAGEGWAGEAVRPPAADVTRAAASPAPPPRTAAPAGEQPRETRDPADCPASADCDGELELERAQIAGRRFTSVVAEWLDRYQRVGHRDVYLWRWTAHAVDLITLSCVAPGWRRHVGETKFLAAMFNVLLDDLADRERQPEVLLELLRRTRDGQPDRHRFAGESWSLTLACQVWDELWRRARQYPRYDEFADLLTYDLRQLCNTVEYSLLIHHNPALINPVEHDLYSSHGMMVACAATLDLMCSPAFRAAEMGLLREAVWHAGCMARIGNLLTTWEREIADHDFSSGIFALAVGRGWLSPGDLAERNARRISAAVRRPELEREFRDRWRAHRACLSRLEGRLDSVDISAYREGLDRLFRSELASRGKK